MNINDAVVLRLIERIVIDIGAIFFGFLGYKLFIFGVEKGTAKFSAQSQAFKIVFSGTAPGLFFMFVAGGILTISVLTKLETEQKYIPPLKTDQPAQATNTPAQTLAPAQNTALSPELNLTTRPPDSEPSGEFTSRLSLSGDETTKGYRTPKDLLNPRANEATNRVPKDKLGGF